MLTLNCLTVLSLCLIFKIILNIYLKKMKNGYKLELQTPETMKLFRSRKELIDKTK